VLELAQQPRLAHAGLAEDGRQMRGAVAGDSRQQHLQGGELVLAPDERGLPVRAPGNAGVLLGQADHTPRRDRLGLALELERLERLVLDHAAGRPLGALADRDGPLAGARLQPRGDIDRVPDHRVVLAHLARQHLARVDAHAERELDAVV